MPRFALYIFDVDGTLVDSAADICGAIQEVLRNAGRDNVSDEFLRGYIGRHLIDTFTDLGFSDCDDLIAEYRRIYPLRGHASTRLYDGVAEALEALPGLKSTATTKSTQTTRVVLEKFGLIRHFHHIQGTDGFPHKPAPDVLLKSIDKFGVSPSDCLFVGDAAADMEAGRRAGVATCAVQYGYGLRQDLARFQPDYWIDDLRQLREL
ncbi:MAG: HAD-IA family hydrolase [Bryobacteraceae bacterium]|nr:HAD-IA family hydrolase [Bryobacteraceae bacterium]